MLRLKSIFLLMALWGFGATAFSMGKGEWWLAIAAGFLMILATFGALGAEIAEEYSARGNDGAKTHVAISELQEKMDEVHADLEDIIARLQEYNKILRPDAPLYDPRPTVMPFAPIEKGVRS